MAYKVYCARSRYLGEHPLKNPHKRQNIMFLAKFPSSKAEISNETRKLILKDIFQHPSKHTDLQFTFGTKKQQLAFFKVGIVVLCEEVEVDLPNFNIVPRKWFINLLNQACALPFASLDSPNCVINRLDAADWVKVYQEYDTRTEGDELCPLKLLLAQYVRKGAFSNESLTRT